MREALTKLEAGVVDALARGEPVDAHAILFLMRRYQQGDRDDLGDVVGRALAMALATHADAASGSTVPDAVAWTGLFIESAAISDDDRLLPAVETLVARLRAHWTEPHLRDSAAAIGACLAAATLPVCREIAAAAIDALEQTVGRIYRPGQGVGGGMDQVRAASALLAAYSLCGRLPYSMLAEELMQTLKNGDEDFVTACEAARVLCRLAVLHDDAGYRAAAVIAPGADYRRDAEGLLLRQTPEAMRLGAAGSIYGVAALELESPDSYGS